MKKLISVLALILVFAFCAAYAESTATPATTTTTTITTFSMNFRNGVKFGMTQDEVRATEKAALHEQQFGEKQNPHVTFLATDTVEVDGHACTVQYLFWDGKMYSVLFNFSDGSLFDTVKAMFETQNGTPKTYPAEGTANWVEGVTGNHPDLTGEQYVWSWDNKISLTMVKYNGGFIALFIDAN